MEPQKYSSFEDIFLSGEFQRLHKLSDGCLMTENGSTFRIHRMFLAFRNDYFRSLFGRDKEAKRVYLIVDISDKTLDQILIYLYTGHISHIEQNARNVMIASHRFGIKDLLKISRSLAIGQMNTTNSLGLFITTCIYPELGISDDCYRYVQVHFEKVISHTENDVGDLQLGTLKKLLSDRNLNVTSESIIWRLIVHWVTYLEPERLSAVPELLSCIYLNESDEDLAKEILNHPIVKYNSFCGELDWITGSHTSTLDSQQATQLLTSTVPRLPSYLYFITYYNISSNSTEVYLTYDEQVDMWRKIGDLEFWPDFIIAIKGNIYFFNAFYNRYFAFDMSTFTFRSLPSMVIPRFHYTVASVEGYIYTLGGPTGFIENSTIVERYDSGSDSWEVLSSTRPIFVSDVVTMNGRMYAIGEMDEGRSLPVMKARVYNPALDCWLPIAAPSVFRFEFASAVFRGRFYVMGGYNPFLCLKTVEVYDPEQDAWQTFPDLPFAYVLPKAVVLEEKLIVYENLLKTKRYGGNYPPVQWNENRHQWFTLDPQSPLLDIHMYQFRTVDDSDTVKELVDMNRLCDSQWQRSPLKKSFSDFA